MKLDKIGESKSMLNAIANKNFLCLATRNLIKTRNVTIKIFICVTRYVTVVELFSGAELRIKKCYNIMKKSFRMLI